ncbi:hypothetical protein PGT21_000195 [Puccinia graminis f. sp. tritici]|uniref:Uncharacterized protein n=1 Tax=Puccinia graminis f. sp. tritici TaxID=56615 RepID=A0A5B0MYP4_PUCGR|nr:hypothetical protein PGT21_000195 [Puccinia graminis f. sp. tritici]
MITGRINQVAVVHPRGASRARPPLGSARRVAGPSPRVKQATPSGALGYLGGYSNFSVRLFGRIPFVLVLIDCPLWAAVTEATEGRGRAVEEALFDNVTVRTPLVRVPAPRRCSVHVQLVSKLSTARTTRAATRLRSPPTTNPGGPPRSPLRAPQTTDTKRDARYYEHSGISDLSCDATTGNISARSTFDWLATPRVGTKNTDHESHGSRATYVHGRADVTPREGTYSRRAFSANHPKHQKKVRFLFAGRTFPHSHSACTVKMRTRPSPSVPRGHRAPQPGPLSSYRRFGNTNRSYSLLSDVHVRTPGPEASGYTSPPLGAAVGGRSPQPSRTTLSPSADALRTLRRARPASVPRRAARHGDASARRLETGAARCRADQAADRAGSSARLRPAP